jgi:hypothetical protein
MTDDERRKLVSTEQSLGMEPEPQDPVCDLGAGDVLAYRTTTRGRRSGRSQKLDADSFFNLPNTDADDDEDDR